MVISPKMMTTPVLTTVSQAMREEGSRVRQASTMASEIVSHSLSGWDSVTDSEVKRYESLIIVVVAVERVFVVG